MKVMTTLMMMMFMKNDKMCMSISTALIMIMTKMTFTNITWVNTTTVSDNLTYWILSMTMWIIMMISLIKTNNLMLQPKIMSFLSMTLLLVFSVWDFFSFFIMFEMSMMLIVILVMMWGYQPERMEATLFMIFMTTIFSLPFFATIMKSFNQTNFWFLMMKMSLWDYMSFMFIFLVKLPVYFIHMWLPKIHVEAPVQGSMILAAVMLKLGCYGLIRTALMTMKINKQYQSIIMAFSLWTVIILSIISLIQTDMKSLIAYSSVVHMTSTLIAISLTKSKSLNASVMMVVGHGLCSSALFLLCNNLYNQSKSRSMLMNKGLLTKSPNLMMLWFILCMSNAPMPPSINMLGEILTFKTVMNWSILLIPIMAPAMIASSYFSIILFYMPAHGKFSNQLMKPMSTSSKTTLIAWLHTTPLILMICKSSIMEL